MKKVYVVMFYMNYEGYAEDNKMRAFAEEEDAKKYAYNLNIEYARYNNCKVADLGDYYEVIEFDLY